MTFQENLQVGRTGESLISKWLRKRNYHVLPVYEIEIQSGKGPRLFSPGRELIAPDMLAFDGVHTLWIEAKHKTAFSWHRLTQCWTTGIDVRHYQDYCEVDQITPFDVWLLFLQRGGQAKDSPERSPSGLFANSLQHLRLHENHRSNNWGKTGMVYWSINELKLIATLETLKKL